MLQSKPLQSFFCLYAFQTSIYYSFLKTKNVVEFVKAMHVMRAMQVILKCGIMFYAF